MMSQSNLRFRQLTMMLLLISSSFYGCDDRKKSAADLQYENARQMVFQGNFEEAAVGFEVFLTENPGHPFSSRATFMLGKTKLGKGDEAAAVKWFEKAITEYPISLEASKAKFKIAMIEFLNDRAGSAQRHFQEIVSDTKGPYTPEATAWLRYLDTISVAPDTAAPSITSNPPIK